MQGASAIPSPVVPGLSTDAAPPVAASGTLELLDQRDEWLEFSRPVPAADAPAGAGTSTGGELWESSVVFEGMYCAACATTIEQALAATPGVREFQVNAASHRGRVVWEEGATRPSEWMRAVQRTGYRTLPAHDAFASARRQAETRKMLWRLGVAGLCMMQVMMYATPEYFTAPGDIEPEAVRLMRWAQWVLSIPVLLFSCRPFFANALRDLRQRSVSMDLPVSLGMVITFVVSMLGTFEPDGVFGREVYFDSFTMFVFFLLCGRWLELRMRDRTAGALEALMHRLPESVERQDARGDWQRVSVRRLRQGDVVRVLPGEAFPADGVLLRGHTSADEALLTGESTPLARGVGDAVIAGSHNLTAPVEMRVQHVGGDTRYAQIVSLMEQASVSKPHIAQLADRLAKPFLIFVLLAAVLACAWWWRTDPGHALMIAVAILVVTCPCALSLATPAAMLASAGSLARRGVLVRRLQALETLAEVNTLVFDKTGTLTRDAFVLADVQVRGGVTRPQAIALAAQLARGSLHPVSRALVQAAANEAADAAPLPALQDVNEVAGQGVRATRADGGELRLGAAAFCGVPVQQAESAQGPVSHLCDAQGWVASFVFREDLRGDARATVQQLQAEGVRVCLLSGDQPAAAAALGRLAGIADARGGCTPAEKLAAMQTMQAEGATVAMVGDGLNDGPVLAGAHVSFAFGRSVPLARAQSDFVVLGEKLFAVADTQRKARRTLRIVRQNLAWAAAYNVTGVPLAMIGWMPAWAAGLGMALSSLLVVANALRLSGADQTPQTA
ncbi:MAG: cation-translocating P-type ATPase [Pseudomonadota bacterium]|nr:cation-translocating P-type ATPase [Pseudomonadota bacterium]